MRKLHEGLDKVGICLRRSLVIGSVIDSTAKRKGEEKRTKR
jgi:hypothetical protein